MSDISADQVSGTPSKDGKWNNLLNNAFHVAVGVGTGFLTSIFMPAAAPIVGCTAAVASKDYFDGSGKNPGVAVKDFITSFFKAPDGP